MNRARLLRTFTAALAVAVVFVFPPQAALAQDDGELEDFLVADYAGREEGIAMAIQADHRLVIAGNSIAGDSRLAFVSRYTSGFSIDESFGNGGTKWLPEIGLMRDLAIQADGKLVVRGTQGIARLLGDGALDSSFGGDGIVDLLGQSKGLSLQADGKMLMFPANRSSVVRLLPDGQPDPGFGVSGTVQLGRDDFLINPDLTGQVYFSDLTVQTDGKIVVVGWFGSSSRGGPFLLMVRLNADGSLDTGFGDLTGTKTDRYFYSSGFTPAVGPSAIRLQPDGKILVGGWTQNDWWRDDAWGDFEWWQPGRLA